MSPVVGTPFMRYLVKRTRDRHASWLPEHDPTLEYYDGTVRIHDQRGESCSLRRPMPRQLRALASMLIDCAEQIEREAYEER